MNRIRKPQSINVFQEVARRLNQHPHVVWSKFGNSISVPAADAQGFDVSIALAGEQQGLRYRRSYGIMFDHVHVVFDGQPREAIHLFLLGLSDASRLEITMRGGDAVEWAIQFRNGEAWETYEKASSLIGFLSDGITVVEHRQNRHIPPPTG